MGIYVLLTPLIRKKLHVQKITAGKTPIITDKQRIQNDKFIGEDKKLKQLEIMQNIRMINIENNLTSEEMYKHIWLTLLLNPIVTIAVENPEELNTNSGFSFFTVDEESPSSKKQVTDL